MRIIQIHEVSHALARSFDLCLDNFYDDVKNNDADNTGKRIRVDVLIRHNQRYDVKIGASSIQFLKK